MGQVKTPRFYVNLLEFLEVSGYPIHQHGFNYWNPLTKDVIRTLPVKEHYGSDTGLIYPWIIPKASLQASGSSTAYMAVLGHNLRYYDTGIKLGIVSPLSTDTDWVAELNTNVVHHDLSRLSINAQPDGVSTFRPDYDGFSIVGVKGDMLEPPSVEDEFGNIPRSVVFGAMTRWADSPYTDSLGYYSNEWGYESYLSTIMFGDYYDMQEPNLSLEMQIEFGGTEEVETFNGSSYSNTSWMKPTWGELPPWELYKIPMKYLPDPSNWNTESQLYEEYIARRALFAGGRRVWRLNFSFVDASSLWGCNQLLNSFSSHSDSQNVNIGYDSADFDASDADGLFDTNLMTDSNFFSQVYHKSIAGSIPMLFQEDKDSTKPDGLAIVRFRDNSLRATETAPGLYDISIILEECW